MSRKYKFLQPTYFKDFKCSAGDCTLDCCDYNWKITIDKKTYEKYRRLKNVEFNEKFKKYLKKDARNKLNRDYASIKLVHSNTFLEYKQLDDKKEEITCTGIFLLSKCPFRNDDKLCSIQKELGYQYLSQTCKVFPRSCTKIRDSYERGLGSGCEEVSKLLLKEVNGVKFEIGEDIYPIPANGEFNFKSDAEIKLFDTTRAMCISILQLPNYKMSNKIMLLSAFLFQLSNIIEPKDAPNKFEDAEKFIDNFSNNISEYEKLFDTGNINHELFLNLFIKELSNACNFNGDVDLIRTLQVLVQRLKDCYTKGEQTKLVSFIYGKDQKYIFEDKPYVKRTPLKTLENGDIVSSKYLKYKKNRDKLMKGKDYYVENILVNSFFSNRYPGYIYKDLKKSCFKFVISYCFYEALLTIYLSEETSLDEQLLHRVCSVWGRKWSDQDFTLNEIYKKFEDMNLNNFSGIALLLKSC